MAQGDERGWGPGRPASGHPTGHRPAEEGTVYRSGAASGDPDATLIIPPVVGGDIPRSGRVWGVPAAGQGQAGPGAGRYGPRHGAGRRQMERPADGPPPAATGEGGGGGSAAGNSAVMAIGSLVSRGTGFLRTLVLTAALGGFLVGNAYTTAQIFPGMVYEFLLGGVLSSVVVPVLVRRRKSDSDGGEAYAQRLLTLAVLALGVATLAAVLAAPLLTMTYASDESSPAFKDLVTALSYLMLPMIFFTGLSALVGALLNTRGHFAAPMWTPILNNLVVIATAGLYIVIFGAKVVEPDQMTPGRIALIGGGTLTGVVVQSIGLLPALRRVGFRWRWRFDFRSLGLRELARLGTWMFCYVAVSQLGLVVVFNLLNRAGAKNEAGPLIYNNVFLLLMMAHGIIAVSIITALMPRMSASAADGRFADLTTDLVRGTRMSTAVLAPVSVCYAVLATPIAVALFNYGAFTSENATATSAVLTAAGLAMVPFAISQLFTFAFYALPDTRTPALINIPVVLLRVLLQVGLFLAFATDFTATGLMLGNAISYLAAVLLSAWLLRRRIGRLGLGPVAGLLGRVALASLGAALVGLLVMHVIAGGETPGRLAAMVQVVVGGAVIGLSYLGLSVLLRITEITEVIKMVRRRLGR